MHTYACNSRRVLRLSRLSFKCSSGKRCSVAYTARPARCPQDKQAGFVLRLWIKHSITHLGTVPYTYRRIYIRITYVSLQESSSRCDSWPFSILSWHSALAPSFFLAVSLFVALSLFLPVATRSRPEYDQHVRKRDSANKPLYMPSLWFYLCVTFAS